MTYHLGRRLVVVAAAAGLVAAAVGSPAYAAPSAASTDGLSVVAVRHSLLGTHTWYQQTYRGLPVLGGFYAVHTDIRTGEVRVQDGRLSVTGSPGIQATFARDRAQSTTAN